MGSLDDVADMLKMQKEVDRKLAKWLGWTEFSPYWMTPDGGCYWILPDFHTEAAANSLVFQKLAQSPHPLTIVCNDGFFTLNYRGFNVVARPITELMAAICDAAVEGESL